MRLPILVASLLVYASWSPSNAQPTVTPINGQIFNTSITLVGGAYNISFDAVPPGPQQTVTAVIRTTSDVAIRYIRVYVDGDASTNDEGVCQLIIDDQGGGEFTQIEEVSVDAGSVGVLWIGILRVDGNLGGSGTTPSGLVVAHSINEVDVSGNVTADILYTDWLGRYPHYQAVV